MDDTRPFPIQGKNWGNPKYDRSSVPWWLAEIAYEEYSKRYGTQQSLQRLGERGGFGREELVELLRGIPDGANS